jgi:hypothetical protein
MKPFYISIPHEVDLKNQSEWTNNAEYEYFAYRDHWLVKPRQLNDTAKTGEKISVFKSDRSTGRVFEGGEEDEWTVTEVEESVKEILVEDELKSTITTELLAEINALSVGKLSSTLKSSLEARWKSSTGLKSTSGKTITKTRKVNFNWKFPIPDKSSDTWVAAAMYQKYAYDVYLAYVDYLFIRYDRPSLFSLRKERFKYPDGNRKKHINWIRVHQARASIEFWNLLVGPAVVTEHHYLQEVADPYELTVRPLSGPLTQTDKPKVPTLYDISNSAFPLKWGKPVVSASGGGKQASGTHA